MQTNKILFITPASSFGGAEQVLYQHIKYLSTQYQCDILLPNIKDGLYKKIKKYINIVYYNQTKIQKLYILLKYDIIYFHYYLIGIIPYIKFIKPQVKYIIILHDKFDALSYLLKKISLKRVNFINLFICVNEEIKEALLKQYSYQINKNKIIVLSNCISIPQTKLKKINHTYRQNIPFMLGYLGRLSSEKNTLDAIKIVKQYNEKYGNKVKLLIGGDIADKNLPYLNYKVHVLEEVLKRENIEYFGYIKDIVSFYKQIDGLIISSFTESGPITGIDSLAMGKPVLSGNIGLMSTGIRNGFNGYTVPLTKYSFNPFFKVDIPKFKKNDIQKFIKALDMFINTKWNYKAIQEDALKKFNPEENKQRFIKTITSLMKN